jgi:hypothetical protein
MYPAVEPGMELTGMVSNRGSVRKDRKVARIKEKSEDDRI